MCHLCLDFDDYANRHGHRCDEDCATHCNGCDIPMCRLVGDSERIDDGSDELTCDLCAPSEAIKALARGTPPTLHQAATNVVDAIALLKDNNNKIEAVRLVMREYLANKLGRTLSVLDERTAKICWSDLVQETLGSQVCNNVNNKGES